MIQTFINDEWVDQQPTHGQKYRKLIDGVVALESYWYELVIPPSLQEFSVKNTKITLNGSVLSPFNGIHFANIAEEIQITAEAHDENGVVDITIPISIKMPIVRYANGMPTDDEVYFNTTLQNGLFTINGSFQRSGDWKIVADRINKALQEIGAEFRLSGQNVTLIA